MQVYAEDEKGAISARVAEKRRTYFCPECGAKVRLRGGLRRQLHFFHIQLSETCDLAQKGDIHLRIQKYLQYLLEEEGAKMEQIFPTIDRIADIACIKTKKVFEIQYSPISFEEAKARCLDYESLGYSVIWILHDHQFNRKKLTQAEIYLRSKNCYYTNMDARGNGAIFDQQEEIEANIRKFTGPPQKINLRAASPIPITFNLPHSKKGWTLTHEGDVIDGLKRGVEYAPKPSQNSNGLKNLYMNWLYRLLEKTTNSR